MEFLVIIGVIAFIVFRLRDNFRYHFTLYDKEIKEYNESNGLELVEIRVPRIEDYQFCPFPDHGHGSVNMWKSVKINGIPVYRNKKQHLIIFTKDNTSKRVVVWLQVDKDLLNRTILDFLQVKDMD